jgi:transcription termination factor Rho
MLQKVWILRKLHSRHGRSRIDGIPARQDPATKNNAEFFDMMRRGG